MDSNLENPSKVCKTKDEEDRLSSFPESILTHILSSVPTKCAARTSILSKRWKRRFLSVQKLVFDEEMLSSDHSTFIDFVSRRLLLCKTNAPITEFRLKLPKLPQSSVINLWVLSLLFRNLKVLEIVESGESDTATPQCPPSEMFGWETLGVLKLSGLEMVLRFPASVIFPSLLVLQLEYLDIQSESEILRFDHEGYPLLKKLQLSWVWFDCSIVGLGIFLCTLETLVLKIDEPDLKRIIVDTPGLHQLKYNVCEVDKVSPVQLSFCKSEKLISAHIYSKFNRRGLHNELLSKTSGVKDLTLCMFAVQHLTYPLPHFANLTRLELFDTGVRPMLRVLQNAPMLEVLILEFAEDLEFVPPTDVPLCLAQKLTKITLRDFAQGEICVEKDVGLVRYFLQHGAVLERLILEQLTPVTREWRLSTFEQLLNLPRRSPKCVIEVPKEAED